MVVFLFHRVGAVCLCPACILFQLLMWMLCNLKFVMSGKDTRGVLDG